MSLSAVVQILSPEGKAYGLGGVLESGDVVTCAHVVSDALGRARDDLIPRNGRLRIRPLGEIDLIGEWATVAAWSRTDEDDIALLRPDAPLGRGVALANGRAGEDVTFYTPRSGGRLAGGEIEGVLPRRRLQVRRSNPQGHWIESGTSGSPVFDASDRLVGVIRSMDAGNEVRVGTIVTAAAIVTLAPQAAIQSSGVEGEATQGNIGASGLSPQHLAFQAEGAPVVLIVDDKDAIEIAEQLPGFRHIIATDVLTAMAMLDSVQRIDIAVIDMMIGEGSATSGRNVLDACNRSDGRRTMPKIVVSVDPQLGRHEASVRRFCDQYVVADVFWKPLDGGMIKGLLPTVRDALNQPAVEVVIAQLDRRAADFAREARADHGSAAFAYLDWLEEWQHECSHRINGLARTPTIQNSELWDAYESFVTEVENRQRSLCRAGD